MLYSYGVVPKH